MTAVLVRLGHLFVQFLQSLAREIAPESLSKPNSLIKIYPHIPPIIPCMDIFF